MLPLMYWNIEMTGVVSGSVAHVVQPPRSATPFMVGFQLSQHQRAPGCMKLSFSFRISPRVGAGSVIVCSCCATCGGTGLPPEAW